jgi:hypothetical protein
MRVTGEKPTRASFEARPQRVHAEDSGGPWVTGGDWFVEAFGCANAHAAECLLLAFLDLSVAWRTTSSTLGESVVLHGTQADMEVVANTLNRLGDAVSMSGLTDRHLLLAAREIPGERLLDYLCAGLTLEQARAYETDGSYDKERLAALTCWE